MKIPLDQLESRLQALIEGSVARLFPIARNQEDLAAHLINAMREHIHHQENGPVLAPNLYILSVHPAQAKVLTGMDSLLEELARLLEKAGSEAGLKFPSAPVIQIEPDNELGLHETRILAQFYLDQDSGTAVLVQPPQQSPGQTQAYLIVDGSQIFPLTGRAVSIGRSPSSDLVLSDRRVSRSHAQLRLVGGRYMIFDLNSTGGTYVNDQHITQVALYPGDVISLAGVPLVFGQETGSASGETQPLPYNPDEIE
jgi:hypothetical protein